MQKIIHPKQTFVCCMCAKKHLFWCIIFHVLTNHCYYPHSYKGSQTFDRSGDSDIGLTKLLIFLLLLLLTC